MVWWCGSVVVWWCGSAVAWWCGLLSCYIARAYSFQSGLYFPQRSSTLTKSCWKYFRPGGFFDALLSPGVLLGVPVRAPSALGLLRRAAFFGLATTNKSRAIARAGAPCLSSVSVSVFVSVTVAVAVYLPLPLPPPVAVAGASCFLHRPLARTLKRQPAAAQIMAVLCLKHWPRACTAVVQPATEHLGLGGPCARHGPPAVLALVPQPAAEQVP